MTATIHDLAAYRRRLQTAHTTAVCIPDPAVLMIAAGLAFWALWWAPVRLR